MSNYLKTIYIWELIFLYDSDSTEYENIKNKLKLCNLNYKKPYLNLKTLVAMKTIASN